MVPLDGTMPTTMITLCIIGVSFLGGVSGIAKSFVNSSMPSMRPTFVVNFDMSTVICQHSADSTDLHLHQMSILCDGKTDCFSNPAMHDESFPYCAGKCEPSCTDRGACLHDGESAQCYCDSGFHGKRCEMLDNNECADKPCHWLAHCQNTLGSYYCSCFPGFEGDGHECNDIDECESGSAKCPENSLCVNLPGTYFCNCTEGFMPKGLPLERCADVDECEEGLHDCPNTHMCQNEIGSFRCVQRCGPGHDLINGTCVDIDECARKDNGCDRRAVCTNTPGSYRCECDAGFEGDGRVCNPMADCSQKEGICDMHAFCVASLRMCLCQAGYVGDGLSCFDVNECVTANNTCQGQKGTRCVNIDGGYLCCGEDVDDAKCMKEQGAVCANRCGLNAHCRNDSCQCVTGFEGDPLTKCTDVNECETRDDVCKGVGQWCVNMLGGHICCGSDSTQSECQGLEISRGRLVTDRPPAEQPTTTSSAARTSAATSATTTAAATTVPPTPTDDEKTNLPILLETSTATVGSGATITISSTEKATTSSGAGISKTGGDLGDSTTRLTNSPPEPDTEATKQKTPAQSTVASTKIASSPTPSTEATTQLSTEPITSAQTSTEPSTSDAPSSTEQSTTAAVEVTTTSSSETPLTTTCGTDSTQSDCLGLEIIKAGLNTTTLAPASSSATSAPISSTESPASSTISETTTPLAVTSTEAITSTTSEIITSTSVEAITSTTEEITTPTTTQATTSTEASTSTSAEAITSTTTEKITSTTAKAISSTEKVTLPSTEASSSATAEATTTVSSTAAASSTTTIETSTATTTKSETKLPVIVESSTATVAQSTAVALENVKTTTEKIATSSSAGDVTTEAPATTTCGPDSTQSDCQGLEIIKVQKTTTQATTVAQTTSTEKLEASTSRATTVSSAATSAATQSTEASATTTEAAVSSTTTTEAPVTSTTTTEAPVTSTTTTEAPVTSTSTTESPVTSTTTTEAPVTSTTTTEAPVTSTTTTEAPVTSTTTTEAPVTSTESATTTTAADKSSSTSTSTAAIPSSTTTSTTTTTVPETTTSTATTTTAEIISTSTAAKATEETTSSNAGDVTTEAPATTTCGPDSTQSDCQGLEIVKVAKTSTQTTTVAQTTTAAETTTSSTTTSPTSTTSSAAASTTSANDVTDAPPAATSSEKPHKTLDKLSPSPIPGSPTSEPSLPPVSFDTPHTAGPVTSESGVLKTTLQATEKPLTALPPIGIPEDKEMFNLTTTTLPSTTTQKSAKCRSSDDCGDDALCERRSGVCRCLPGFEGMPPTTPCQDVNECKDGLDDCDSSTTCMNFIGGYSCLCDIGYRKGDGGACFDINECDERTPCHKNGECRNLPGSYSCSCRPGFTGDGYRCIPLEKRPCNEKEAQKQACGRNRLCLVDGLDVADCNTCKSGFELVQGECTDINECTGIGGSNCHSNADCTNLMGSYSCKCKPGFRGDGFICQDIDECEAGPCHPLAMCKNTIGSFECQCPDGWSGDGKQSCLHPTDKACENVQSACGRPHHTACLTVDDGLGAICECELGFRYHNGTNRCNDIDECQEGRNGCDPASTVCINRMGEYSCECTNHFEGVGGVCVEVDECAKQISNCDPNARCINEIGGYECICAAGYTGNGRTCTPISGDDKRDECTKIWNDLCRQENKTCLLDDQGDAQCGACIEGHHPIENRCEPVAGPGDCADPAKNDCHKNAECIDVKQGKHFCVCKVGYIGDGRHCDDVDECSIRSVCDERAVCRNTPGSFVCTCPRGFVGDGTQCKGPNCQSDSSLCHQHAECLLDGVCRCLAGYVGDGTTSCVALSTTTLEPSTVASTTIVTTTSASTTLATTSSTSTTVATTTSASTAAPTTTVRKCSRVEGIFCHELAICQPDGTCKCYDGFEGDGHLSCLPLRVPHDPKDCETNSGLCSAFATCQDRRCRCRIGYTGDGITCVSLETKTDCSKCHPEAVCTEGVCACKTGYLGNGDTCMPDPKDCFIYPNLCHASATCISQTRRCDCNEGFVGDGTICAKKEQQSCLANPNLCHEDAKCLDGVCKCNHGFHGDGASCNAAVESPKSSATVAPTTFTTGKACADGHDCNSNADCIDLEPIGVGHECRCKTGFYGNGSSCEDINECETSVGSVNCHHMAKCINVVGSFSCVCPSGFTGDGVRSCIPSQLPDYIGVDCEADGMTLVITDKTDPFNGRIFVREQSDNPFCSRRFNKINDTGPEYRFKVPFAHCNIRKESFDTFAVTVVVQKHPMFITEAADAYDLRCTYPTGVKDVMSHINVSMLATAKSFVIDGHKATCSLTINDASSDAKMAEATVGQMLRLKLAVEPHNLYSILPRNCFAVNMESGDTYSLTDQAGCAVDTQLFPEWHRDIPSETYADFRTFKWPDSSHLRFQCDCSACAGECPKVNCARRRLALFRRRFRYRYVRSPTTASPYHAYSQVLTVDDAEEERQAQRQLELWMAADDDLWLSSKSALVEVVPMSEEEVCLTAPWIGATVGLAGLCAIICAGITTILFCRRRPTAGDDGTVSSLTLF